MAAAQRRLAAILFSDIVGYTALMAESEVAGLAARRRHRSLLRSLAARHQGRIVDENGDELLLVFASDLDAVHCALAAQARLREDPRLRLRIGIHSGDVIFEGGRVYGDGVNVASRIRPLAEPGGVAISEPVFDAVKGQAGLTLTPLGTHTLKNVARPLAVHAVSGEVETPGRISTLLSEPRIRRAALGVALAIAAAGALFLVRDRLSSSAALPASVAVLPFADMSPSDQEFFADGMTEEIINALARLPDLRVVARTSAFAFKGKDADIRTIGATLGVRHVVEGSVRRSGERLRVTAQLVSVADGYHVWSETYDRELADVFAIQEDVATRVAEALSVRIGGRSLAPRPAKNLRAYELYLTGHQLWSLQTEGPLRQSIDYFEKVLALDPDYAPARSGIADALIGLWVQGFVDDRAVLERARESAEAALRADPSLAGAHASLARLEFSGGTWNWRGAEAHLLRAIELDPGYSTAHLRYAYLLMCRARVEEALAEIQRALELDPLSPLVLSSAAQFASITADHERAIQLNERVVHLAPEFSRARFGLAGAYAAAGREDEALETILPVVPTSAQPALRSAYEAEGGTAMRRELLRTLQERAGGPCAYWASAEAVVYAGLGDRDGVFRCLRAEARQGEFLTYVQVNPVFAPYRSDPRYAAYLKSINLSE